MPYVVEIPGGLVAARRPGAINRRHSGLTFFWLLFPLWRLRWMAGFARFFCLDPRPQFSTGRRPGNRNFFISFALLITNGQHDFPGIHVCAFLPADCNRYSDHSSSPCSAAYRTSKNFRNGLALVARQLLVLPGHLYSSSWQQRALPSRLGNFDGRTVTWRGELSLANPPTLQRCNIGICSCGCPRPRLV